MICMSLSEITIPYNPATAWLCAHVAHNKSINYRYFCFVRVCVHDMKLSIGESVIDECTAENGTLNKFSEMHQRSLVCVIPLCLFTCFSSLYSKITPWPSLFCFCPSTPPNRRQSGGHWREETKQEEGGGSGGGGGGGICGGESSGPAGGEGQDWVLAEMEGLLNVSPVDSVFLYFLCSRIRIGNIA